MNPLETEQVAEVAKEPSDSEESIGHGPILPSSLSPVQEVESKIAPGETMAGSEIALP